jgi:hypothetical protein
MNARTTSCLSRSATNSAFVLLLSLLASIGVRADVILDWNSLMIAAIRSDNSGPTLSSRNLAILHTAIYDAVNSIDRTHQPYKFQVDAPQGASAEAAAVGAAYEITKVLYQPFRAQADDLYGSWVAVTAQTAAVKDGLAFGQRIAQLMLQDRAADGSSTDVPYIVSDAPGQWRRTPPFLRPPLTPGWRYVTPFCLPSLEPFLPGPPPALDSPEYADALNYVKAIGSVNSTTRTDEQTLIAKFWSDFSYTSMPPGHWHLIAETISRDRHNSLADNARLFALISLAQADGAIACWEIKYRYNTWRPVTAIARADEDNNPLTDADQNWTQLLPSPPFPSYTSGHSTFSKASAEVLTHFYGTDAITFSTTGDATPGVIRAFHSLAACADEVGMSRVYGGFHYMFDNVAGKECGQKVGDYVSENFLLPNDSLPLVRMETVQNGRPNVRVHGHIGRPVVLEGSTDLRAWSALSTNTAVSGGVLVEQNYGAAALRAFFRARELAP